MSPGGSDGSDCRRVAGKSSDIDAAELSGLTERVAFAMLSTGPRLHRSHVWTPAQRFAQKRIEPFRSAAAFSSP